MTEPFFRISEAARKLNISRGTLRNLAVSGKIEHETTPAGQRVFTQSQLDTYLGKTPSNDQVVFYVRDSGGDKVAMESQIEKLTQVYGKPVKVYKDGASGLNENRRGLKSLLTEANKGHYNTLAITAKDRLTRFGYSYLEELLRAYGVSILVLEEEPHKSLYDELMQDFMSLVTSFAGKFYRLRGLEQKKRLLQEAGDQLDQG